MEIKVYRKNPIKGRHDDYFIGLAENIKQGKEWARSLSKEDPKHAYYVEWIFDRQFQRRVFRDGIDIHNET